VNEVKKLLISLLILFLVGFVSSHADELSEYEYEIGVHDRILSHHGIMHNWIRVGGSDGDDYGDYSTNQGYGCPMW